MIISDIGARVVPVETSIKESVKSLQFTVELFDPTNITLEDLQMNLQVSILISGDTGKLLMCFFCFLFCFLCCYCGNSEIHN